MNKVNLRTKGKNKIFISHSSKDIEYVKSFVEHILRLGLDIPSDRIFCSSMEGYDVNSGQYIPDRLKEEIKNSSLALLFISENYKSSEICLNEVGAAWATLEKECVIPILLPNIEFSEVGFLDLSRLGLKINDWEGILKLIQDCQEQLNADYHLVKLYKEIDTFLNDISKLKNFESTTEDLERMEIDEQTECFINNLYPFNEIIRKAIPSHEDGIHKIEDVKIQNQILTDLSQAKFLSRFWYRKAEGDYYVERLKKLPTGNWLISIFNWEVKIVEMWVCMDSSLDYEFVLIKTDALDPFKIDSDIGGTSHNVGVLSDGRVVSKNEEINGYAIFNKETINLEDHGIEPRYRVNKQEWVFLVSFYHKLGYNAEETINFCKKLDKGEIEVNAENIKKFLRSLNTNPIVGLYR